MKGNTTKVFFLYGKNNSKIEAVAIDMNSKEEIARREVLLRGDDKPNKLIGRKYAFKKLMTHVHTNRMIQGEEVNLLWKSFASMCKQPNMKLAY